jgi:hypothetical protein
MLGSYMLVVGCVGFSRQNNIRPGIAEMSSSSCPVHRAMLIPSASLTVFMSPRYNIKPDGTIHFAYSSEDQARIQQECPIRPVSTWRMLSEKMITQESQLNV